MSDHISSIVQLGYRDDTVLLRPHRLDQELVDGDFDFLSIGGRLLGGEIEERFGSPVVSIERTYVHQRYYRWGQIDVLPTLEWNGFAYADAEEVIREAVRDEDGIRRPRLGHDGVISWLTSLLWGGFFKEKYSELIQWAAREDGVLMKEVLKKALGRSWASEFMDWALEERPEESALYVKEIRRALKYQQLRHSFGDTLKSVGRHWGREARLHWKPPLPLIAFLGPDGSGKSSVINGFCKYLDTMRLKQRLLHWRPYGLSERESEGAPVTSPHADPPRGWPSSVAKLGMLFSDWWLGCLTVLRHARAKTSVVVSDRYYADMLVDPIRYRYGASMRLARWAFRFFPKPDLVFIMVGDADVIYPRKKEVTLQVLKDQLIRYRALGGQLGEKARVIDVNKPLGEVIVEVCDAVEDFLRGKPYTRPVSKVDRQLRVAQFVPHYPSVEGISAYCRGLSREMDLLEPGSCPVITLRTNLDKVTGDEELLHYPHRSWNPMSLPRQLIKDLERNVHDLDGVVFHGAYHPKIGVLRKQLERMGMPYIFVPHDPYVPELTRHHAIRKWFFWHAYEKGTIQGALAVQLLASEHEEPLRRLGFNVPTEVIPNGCELETLSIVPNSDRRPDQNERVKIQFIGRMDRNHKGLDLLIMAFAEFAKIGSYDNVDLVLTGNDWEDREELETMAVKLGLQDRVIFTGPRPEHSLVILSEADLVILPSRFDGFGLCIVEAMLAARPVLVSNRAGVSSHVAEAGGGWLLEPSVEGIKKALIEACGEKERWEKMGEANREYVTNNLTWKQAAQKTLEMYRRHF